MRLADVQPGHVVVDAFGGTGNIPIEAAVRFSGVRVTCTDLDTP